MKLQQSKLGQFFLSLPLAIVKAKGWVKGQELEISFGPRGELIIKEAE